MQLIHSIQQLTLSLGPIFPLESSGVFSALSSSLAVIRDCSDALIDCYNPGNDFPGLGYDANDSINCATNRNECVNYLPSVGEAVAQQLEIVLSPGLGALVFEVIKISVYTGVLWIVALCI